MGRPRKETSALEETKTLENAGRKSTKTNSDKTSKAKSLAEIKDDTGENTIKSKYKLTIDLSDENREKLEYLKARDGIPYGTTVNKAMSLLLSGILNEDVRKEMTTLFTNLILNIYRELDGAGEWQKEQLLKNLEEYSGLLKLYSGKNVISIDKPETKFKTTIISGGYIKYPENYILLNEDMSTMFKYACVIECRNAEKYGLKHFGEPIPHFIYLCEKESLDEYDLEFYSRIHSACIKAWPNFKDVLKNQVFKAEDPEDPLQIINYDEWLPSPAISYYTVFIEEDGKDPSEESDIFDPTRVMIKRYKTVNKKPKEYSKPIRSKRKSKRDQETEYGELAEKSENPFFDYLDNGIPVDMRPFKARKKRRKHKIE